MSTAWVHAYLVLQVLMVVGWVATSIAAAQLSARSSVRVGRVFLLGAVCLPFLPRVLGQQRAFEPTPELLRTLDELGAGAAVDGLRVAAHHTSMAVNVAAEDPPAWVILPVLVVGITAWMAVNAWLRLRRLVREAEPYLEEDGVEIRVSDAISVPFAAWLFGRRVVMIDKATFDHETDRQTALLHELQHHVHFDTGFAYLHIALRTLCLFNPFAHLWLRQLAELEEFAVDEAVVASGRITPRDYGRCLVRAAERAQQGSTPIYAVTLSRGGAKSLLHRRIKRLARSGSARGAAGPVILVVGVIAMTASAWAADAVLEEVGLADKAIVHLTEQSRVMDIQYPSDGVVQEFLERVAGSPARVEAMRAGIERSEPMVDDILEVLRSNGMPYELAAVPLVESGYRNLEAPHDDPFRGAGLWQLQPETARAYGLRVDETVDERLDPLLSTTAALHLLNDLYNEFDDWALALAAYHQGRRAVRRAVRTLQTRDVNSLIERGLLEPYAAEVLGAALLMDAPDALEIEDPWWSMGN